ncbi:MAG TPA: Do family serine endopeptidase [Gemmatimonadales bacterium]|nr:Do family serine endopeptidase [Gemmatimonadales bacterium]
MNTRTSDWLKLGVLVALAVVLALGFAAAVDLPSRSEAQQGPVSLVTQERPATRGVASAVDLGDAFASVAEAVRPSVVFIQADQRAGERQQLRRRLPPPFDEFFQQPDVPERRRGQGTGFIISPDGYIITNNHVVQDADRLRVRLLDRRVFDAKIVGRDPDTDVAVIKIDATGLHAVKLGNSDSVRIGEWVLAIGNPLEFAFTVTAGIVSAKGRVLQGLNVERYAIQDFIQTDAAINPGNSGGPLVNIYGQVVGMNTAIASLTGFYQGYGFAVPINLARIVAEQLIANGRVTRAILGVSIRDADADDAAYVGLDSVRGVVVQDYSVENGPAERAGLQPGDVITEIDGHPIEQVPQLQQMVGFRRPGDRVRLTVVRKGGERRTITVTLGRREDDTQDVAQADREPASGRQPFEDKLGISVEPVSADLAARARLSDDHRGLLITGVDPDGPAADKGLGPRQIVTHVNNERVRSIAELRQILKDVKPGDVVSLRVYLLPADPSQPGQSVVVRLRAGG